MSEVELLRVYALYPRKVGKSDGLKVLRSTVTTVEDLEECLIAVKAFCREMAGQDPKFIRHFDRWARSWRDWVGEKELPLLATAKSTERISSIPQPSGPVVAGDELRDFAKSLLGRLK